MMTLKFLGEVCNLVSCCVCGSHCRSSSCVCEGRPTGRGFPASLYGGRLVTWSSRCERDRSTTENFEPLLKQASAEKERPRVRRTDKEKNRRLTWWENAHQLHRGPRERWQKVLWGRLRWQQRPEGGGWRNPRWDVCRLNPNSAAGSGVTCCFRLTERVTVRSLFVSLSLSLSALSEHAFSYSSYSSFHMGERRVCWRRAHVMLFQNVSFLFCRLRWSFNASFSALDVLNGVNICAFIA